MKQEIKLESKAFAQGNIPFSMATLPTAKRIAAIRVRAELVFTTGAAAALIAGSQLFRLFQIVQMGKLIDTSGQDLHDLDWLQEGRERYLPASIPATNSKPFQRIVQFDIPWFDPTNDSPEEIPPQTEESVQNSLNLNVPLFSSLGAGTWDTLASITGTINVWAVLADNKKKRVNAKCRIGAVDVSSQTIQLPPGLYEHVWIGNKDGTGITNAEITGVTIKADGEILNDQMSLTEKVESWNDRATGANVRADSATAPIAGCRFNTVPSVAADATNAVTVEKVPLITKFRRAKLSGSVVVQNGLEIKLTGTKTTDLHVAFKMLEAHDESSLVSAMHRQGVRVRGVTQLDNLTTSGMQLTTADAKLAPFLPAKVAGS